MVRRRKYPTSTFGRPFEPPATTTMRNQAHHDAHPAHHEQRHPGSCHDIPEIRDGNPSIELLAQVIRCAKHGARRLHAPTANHRSDSEPRFLTSLTASVPQLRTDIGTSCARHAHTA
jgi:hypothetical protein